MCPKRKPSKTRPGKSKVSIRKRAKKAQRRKRAVKPKHLKKAPKKKQAKKKTASTVRNRRSSRIEEGVVSGRRSADLQGLSRAEQADSESVEELVDEGNIVEAGAVAGVEEADNADEREVHTHEVPEDDVPEEYLDKE
jgi:hypothetical protein